MPKEYVKTKGIEKKIFAVSYVIEHCFITPKYMWFYMVQLLYLVAVFILQNIYKFAVWYLFKLYNLTIIWAPTLLILC